MLEVARLRQPNDVALPDGGRRYPHAPIRPSRPVGGYEEAYRRLIDVGPTQRSTPWLFVVIVL